MDPKPVDIVADVLVTNPNAIPIPLVDINYLINSNERKLISGTISDTGTIHTLVSGIIKVPLTLIYEDIKSTNSEIEPDTILPYRALAELIVDVPVIARITIPV